jgi:hypothetical protein
MVGDGRLDGRTEGSRADGERVPASIQELSTNLGAGEGMKALEFSFLCIFAGSVTAPSVTHLPQTYAG